MAYSWTQKDADQARADDARHNREHPAINHKGGIQWRRSVDQRALMEGLKSEGIASDPDASEAYMVDMEKRYPEILSDDKYRHRHPVRAGRFGRATQTCINGKWYSLDAKGNMFFGDNKPLKTLCAGYVLPSHVQE